MKTRRSGLTLIEMTVATAIISVVAAVALPAVMQARESARGRQCLSNLRQLGLANHNYADVYHRFVPAYVATFSESCAEVCSCGQIGPVNDFNMHTWGSFLLPFLDASSVAEKIDNNSPLFSPINMTSSSGHNYTALNSGCPSCDTCAAKRPLATVLPVYLCPSSPHPSNPFVEKTQDWNCFWSCFGFKRLSGSSDYHALGGYYHELLTYYTAHNGGTPPVDRRGILNDRDCGVSPGAVIDGLSTTIFCAEMAGLPDLWIRGTKRSLPTPVKNWIVSNPGGCWGCFRNAEYWVTGSSYSGTSIGSVSAICVFNCTNESYLNFIYSFHPGVGAVAMADGSARFLSERINPVLMCNLVTYRGNEVVVGSF